jgi:hypothetical protein
MGNYARRCDSCVIIAAIMVIPPQRPRPGAICTLANGADKVGIPAAGVIRPQIRRRDPEMVYFTPPTSVVCVVAP